MLIVGGPCGRVSHNEAIGGMTLVVIHILNESITRMRFVVIRAVKQEKVKGLETTIHQPY